MANVRPRYSRMGNRSVTVVTVSNGYQIDMGSRIDVFANIYQVFIGECLSEFRANEQLIHTSSSRHVWLSQTSYKGLIGYVTLEAIHRA